MPEAKVTVVGAGQVGATAALLLAEERRLRSAHPDAWEASEGLLQGIREASHLTVGSPP